MQVERLSFKELEGAAGRPGGFRPAGKLKADAPPPPPTFSEEELKAAERDGYKKGFLEGTQEGKKQAESEQATIDKQLVNTVEKFAEAAAPLLTVHRQTMLEARENLPKLALAIAKKAAGQALAENAQAVISELAQHACELLIKEPKLTITVQESMADALTKRLEQIAARLPAATDIVILRDPNLPPADCRIEWEHGSMERRAEHIWQQLEKAVENMSATAHQESPASLEPPQPKE